MALSYLKPLPGGERPGRSAHADTPSCGRTARPCHSSGELTAARRTGEDGGHVLEELQPAVERPAGDHFEAHVRISVVDPLPPGAAGVTGKTTTRKRSTRPASSNDQHN